jgi:23S rRNA pseudouridine1911/1915/1917 synthase
MNCIHHTVEEIDPLGMRIDRYISDVLKLFSRSQVKTRVDKLLLNNKEIKISKKIQQGDNLVIYYSDPPPLDLVPEKMDLTIVFEDKNTIVIDKPQGLVVHPGTGNRTGTLLNGVLDHCHELIDNFSDTSLRPGIVHRLDKDTSGIIVVAKNPEAHEFLSNQFRKRRVKKIYIAIVKGSPPEQEGVIETLIERDFMQRKRFMCSTKHGKKAVTFYRLLKSYDNYSIMLLAPKTGRTHQLRVHMKHLNCPIVGDPIYGRKDHHFPEASLMLHAVSIRLSIPFEKKRTKFKSPVPLRFKLIVKALKNKNNAHT